MKNIFLGMLLLFVTLSTQAQENSEAKKLDEKIEVIEVKGTRANLQSAQNVKRLADTVVDGISAEDIGVLPDRSVLEAIQRVPGV